MNRICRSTDGDLEVVINITKYRRNSRRQLVHFSRDFRTGRWNPGQVISKYPESGGSIIQNLSPRLPLTDGDLEVLVIENCGALKHYTGCNVSGSIVWISSGTVHDPTEFNPPVSVLTAASLIQTRIPVPKAIGSNGTTLETVVLLSSGELQHYRCPQFGMKEGSYQPISQWERHQKIHTQATAPPTLYQFSEDSFGPSCFYIDLSPTNSHQYHAIVHTPGQIIDVLFPGGDRMGFETVYLPEAISQVFKTGIRKIKPDINTVSTVSNLESIGSEIAPPCIVDAMVFHPCATGIRDTWMILHWTLIRQSRNWAVSGVILPHVEGMPL
ncbi:hypothetical protein F5Y12DRAFT_798662 [Xylaria sp. FL1777]|nr:hypothetical protein F5Y12DRAFT_798662 [Xylaria sp. FL1777]